MKMLQGLLIVALLAAVGIAWHQLNEIESKNPLVRSMASFESSTTTNSETLASPAVKQSFAAMVTEEATAISQLNSHPEEVEKRLKDLAGKMQESDVSSLQENALNPNLNGDQRFLSVYILGESALERAQESLEAIASTPIPETREARMLTQEEVIRGHAVESIRNAEALKRVLTRSDNGFINDRAQRNLLHIEGKASSPEQQDQEALTKLLEKSR